MLSNLFPVFILLYSYQSIYMTYDLLIFASNVAARGPGTFGGKIEQNDECNEFFNSLFIKCSLIYSLYLFIISLYSYQSCLYDL